MKEGSVACQLDPRKVKVHRGTNQYNQNFTGVYCKCHRPYPDSENGPNEQLQCLVCEDWYHLKHLADKAPRTDAFDELICGGCMEKHSFLKDYAGLSVSEVEDADGSAILNVTSLDESTSNQTDEASSPEAKKIKLTNDGCVRPKADLNHDKTAATFWKVNWRKSLCQCPACLKMYEEEKVEFLCDIEDTTQFYEKMGKDKEKPSEYMASLEALNTLPRGNLIDAISSYNQMKEKLFEFLQTFVVNNQIVTEEDIQRFFRNMKDSNSDQAAAAAAAPQHFCR